MSVGCLEGVYKVWGNQLYAEPQVWISLRLLNAAYANLYILGFWCSYMASSQFEHVTNALLAAHSAVYALGSSASDKTSARKDLQTRGDVTANEAIIGYFKSQGFPAVILTEESSPVKIVENPRYAVVADDIDGTFNMAF